MPSNNYTYSDELYHYGVLGMKWGVRRYQDYDGRRLKNGKRVYNGKKTAKKYKTGMSAFISQRENERKIDYYESPDGGYSDEDFTKLTPENINDYVRPIRENDDYDRTSFDNAVNDVGRAVVKQYGQDSAEANNNCGCISSSLICRKKGYDVYAGPMSDGISNEAIGYYFDDSKREDVTKDTIQDTIKSHGPGSYGIMAFKTNAGNGHFTVWEVDDDENIKVHEGQAYDSEKNFTFDEYDQTYGVNSDGFKACVYDLTNSTPNFEHMAEDHIVLPHNDNAISMYNDKNEDYDGFNYENTSFDQRRRMYGV